MANLALILEQELEEAVEVKNPKSLHRYILLLTDNLVARERYDQDVSEIKSDVRVIADTMKQGFEEMNRRFEGIAKRFEDMNRRFEELGRRSNIGFTYMNIIMGVLVLITVLFKFI